MDGKYALKSPPPGELIVTMQEVFQLGQAYEKWVQELVACQNICWFGNVSLILLCFNIYRACLGWLSLSGHSQALLKLSSCPNQVGVFCHSCKNGDPKCLKVRVFGAFKRAFFFGYGMVSWLLMDGWCV